MYYNCSGIYYSFAVMQFCWPNWIHGIWCLMMVLVIVMAMLSTRLIENAFYSRNVLYRFSGVPYAELFCAGGIFAAGMALCGLGYRRVKKDG